MAGSQVELKKTESLLEEFERWRQDVRNRAYQLFQERGRGQGRELSDWLDAERQLAWKPAIELRRRDNHFEVLAAMAGVDPNDVEVDITPEEVLIKAETVHEHKTESETVYSCEFSSGKVFRSVHFPTKINPDSATAEYRNGVLHITASIADGQSAPAA